ncbi:TonB-dependent receptor [Nostoc sp. 3335mG]|nr:TonB-dependent receptor [Nostoc sp. 3335mG]
MVRPYTGIGALALASLSPGIASAQSASQPAAPGAQIGEIVVTAQKRAEKLQDVPIAVSAISGDQIRDKRIADIVDLSNQAPGLQIKADDTAANPRIFIRGVGVNDFNPTTASAVGIYVDGVYVGSPLAQRAGFFDLQQVEVLRGPQGTLYGRNTTGGAINLTTRKPGDTYEGDLSVEYGRFNSVDVQGGVSVPLSKDLVSFRLAGLFQRDDGFSVNRLTGNRGNNAKRWDLRGTFRITPASNVTDDLVFSGGHSRGSSIFAYERSLMPTTAAATGPDGLCAPGYYTSGQCTNILGYANTSKNLYQGDYRFEGKDKVNLFGVTNTLTVDLGAASIVSVSAFQRATRDDLEETDANPLEVIASHYLQHQNTTSQELRLQSNAHPRLRYVVGLYYAHDTLGSISDYNVLPPFQALIPDLATQAAIGFGHIYWPFHQTTDSYAAFGQLDYDLTDRLSLTGGLRYSADHKDFHYISELIEPPQQLTLFTFDGAKTFRSVSGRAGIQYKLNPSANLYATYDRGTKSGGFFSGETTTIDEIGPYKDETVNAYQAGIKTEWFGRKLRANLAAFYYDYQNLQVYQTVVHGLITEQLFTNASAARMYGGELELEATPARGLDLTLNTALLSAKYRNFKSEGANYSGNTLPSAPKVSIQGSVHYEHDLAGGRFIGEIDATYRSKIYFDTSNVARLSDPGRTFVDGRIGWRLPGSKYEAGVWAKNIFDVTNISDISPVASLYFDQINPGPPRTFGLYVRARY